MPLRRPIPESLPLRTTTEFHQESQATSSAVAPPSARKEIAPLYYQSNEPGTVTVYGLGGFPVTLPYEEWEHLLAHAEEFRSFLQKNRHRSRLP